LAIVKEKILARVSRFSLLRPFDFAQGLDPKGSRANLCLRQGGRLLFHL